jgi:hypothetical protein
MVRQYARTVAAVGPMSAGLGAMRVAAQRREALAARSQRQRECKRNLWRAGHASGLLMVAVGTGFFAGVSSGPVTTLFFQISKQDVLAIASAKRADLRTGRVLFTLPDGETCRPMYFDNKTGEMSPGAGPVPCHAHDANAAAHLNKFSWGGTK